MSDFARFFRRQVNEEEARDAEIINLANEIIDFSRTSYYPKFIAWLEAEALKPMKISKDSSDMIEAAVRANTLKEVRDTLVSRISKAKAALTVAEEE